MTEKTMFKNWINLSLAILFHLTISCSHGTNAGTVPIPLSANEVEINPGKVKLIRLSMNPKYKKIELICDGKKIPVIENALKNEIEFFLSESFYSVEKEYKCFMSTLDNDLLGKVDLLKVKVKPIKYPEEVLQVDSKKVELSKKDLKRAVKERAILDQIYKTSNPQKYFSANFVKPMESVITSYYGTARVYNSIKNSPHLGVDFRAAEGERVPVTNDGKVVFADNLFFTGYTVIVDHGLNIFSVYAHLSKLQVKAEQFVKRGDLLGLSGKTGRVSGPHLHWGIKINGEWIDGLDLSTLDIVNSII